MTGAEMIIHALQQEGVRALFGYPGGMVIDIFDALYSAGMPFYLTRHEQGAAHAVLYATNVLASHWQCLIAIAVIVSNLAERRSHRASLSLQSPFK